MIDMFENILTLFMTCFGLLGCMFAYIKVSKKSYLYFTLFFLFSFLSEYYWNVHFLLLHTDPPSSSLMAYLGWNIGYFFLLLATISIKNKSSGAFFHPLMLLPIPLNIYQFSLYIQYGGLFNNFYQVGITTVISMLCIQEILYAAKHKKAKSYPHTAGIVLIYLMSEYVSWTASCFTFKDPFTDPYLYATLLKIIAMLTFAFCIQKDKPEPIARNWAEFRFRLFYQGCVAIVILTLSLCGYFLARRIQKEGLIFEQAQSWLAYIISAISVVLILIIVGILRVVQKKYTISNDARQKMTAAKRAKVNIIMAVIITFTILFGTMIYNAAVMYGSGVKDIYENKRQNAAVASEEIVHYMGRATTALQSVAETAAYMRKNGASTEEIKDYLTDQTSNFAMVPDNTFIGFYGYIDGKYIDGTGWEPSEDYKPEIRSWYMLASKEAHRPVIVPPYQDVVVKRTVTTIAKNISKDPAITPQDIICLDMEVDPTQKLLLQYMDESDTGLIVNSKGNIIICTNPDYVNQNISDIYGDKLTEIVQQDEYPDDITIDGINYILNVRFMLIDLKLIMLTDRSRMFGQTYARIAITILAGMISIGLVILIYYFNYRVEEYSILRINNLNNQMAEALAHAIDAKDTYTNGHSVRVAKYSKMIAARAGFSESSQESIHMMGLLHDIGKIGIPDAIISKTSGLTDEEYDLIKSHPVMGDDILKDITENPMLTKAARWHHEHYDGTGYPDHLKGDEIPVEVRIIAVADAYDAMTSKRSYRDIMPQERARNEISKGSGTQFDPRFAKVMLMLIDEDKDYEMREHEKEEKQDEPQQV